MRRNTTYHKYRSQGRCARCGDAQLAAHVVLCQSCLEKQAAAKRAWYDRVGHDRWLARYDAPGPNTIYCCGPQPHPVTLDQDPAGTPLLRLPCCGRVFRLTTTDKEATSWP
jgi:hypothetical protein